MNTWRRGREQKIKASQTDPNVCMWVKLLFFFVQLSFTIIRNESSTASSSHKWSFDCMSSNKAFILRFGLVGLRSRNSSRGKLPLFGSGRQAYSPDKRQFAQLHEENAVITGRLRFIIQYFIIIRNALCIRLTRHECPLVIISKQKTPTKSFR